MTPAERYREYAADCVRVAQQIQDPADKMLLLQMAEKWRQLAERAGKDERDKSSTAD